MGRGFQGLGLDQGVVFAAPGHDHYVVVLPDGDEVRDAGVIYEYGCFCLGEELLLAEVPPILQNRAAKVYGRKGGNQSLGYVAVADGAGDTAVFGDEHPGSRTRGGAGAGHYGDQDSVLTLG